MIRSPFFYVGDKAQLVAQIKEELPAHINRYFEPFLGGGSVAMNIVANEYRLSDINENVINLHKKLSSQENLSTLFRELATQKGFVTQYDREKIPISLKKEFPKTYYAHYNRDTYIKLRDEYNSCRDENLLYLLIIYGFNRIIRYNNKGQFNLPVGNLVLNDRVCNALDNYEKFSKKNIIFTTSTFDKLFEVEFKENDFVYLDPPYLITNAEYNKIWNEEQEIKLYEFADHLDKKGVKFMISNVVKMNNNTNTHLEKFMCKYNVIDVESNYISFNNNKKKKIKEILVKNY